MLNDPGRMFPGAERCSTIPVTSKGGAKLNMKQIVAPQSFFHKPLPFLMGIHHCCMVKGSIVSLCVETCTSRALQLRVGVYRSPLRSVSP